MKHVTLISSITWNSLFILIFLVGCNQVELNLEALPEAPKTKLAGTIITPSNGTYFDSEDLVFGLSFSSPVTVTGTPQLQLDVGGNTVYADYISGSGTTDLVFRYTVSGKLIDNDGISATQLIHLNGGSILDPQSESVSLDLSYPDMSSILVDGSFATITSIDADASLDMVHGAGVNIDIVVTFSEAINASSTTLTLDNGLTASYLSGNGTTSITYRHTTALGGDSSDLNVTSIDLSAGTTESGRPLSSTLPTSANLADNRAIVISTVRVTNVTSSSADGSYSHGEPIDISITFSTPVTLAGGNATILMNTTPARSAICPPQDNVTTLNCSFTSSFGDTSSDLNYANTSALSLVGPATLVAHGTTVNGNLTLPAPAGAGSLGTNKNIIILPQHLFNGKVTAIHALDNGKIYVAGEFTQYGRHPVKRLIRLNADLTLDTAFDPPGGPDNNIETIMEVNDGSGDIYIQGVFRYFNSVRIERLARINSDGTLDSTFTSNAGVGFGNSATECNQTPDASLFCSGQFATWNGINSNRIAKLKSDGTIDTSFVTGSGFDDANSFSNIPLKDGSGVIVFTQRGTSYNGQTMPRGVTKLGPTGVMDPVFNANIAGGFPDGLSDYAQPGTVLSHDGSKVFFTGPFLLYNGRDRMASINSDGTFNLDFDSKISRAPNRIFVSIDGSSDLFFPLKANSTSYNGVGPLNKLLKIDSLTAAMDAAFDASMGTGFEGTGAETNAFAAAVDGTGRLFVGGSFTSFNGDSNKPYFTVLNTISSSQMPTITNVTSSDADGTYTAGMTIDIEVNYSEAVTLAGGNAEILLNTTPRRKAICAPQISVTTLICSYTVQPGDDAPRLDYYDNYSFYLTPGATLNQTLTPNNRAVMRLPTTGSPKTLKSQANIVVDGI